MKFPDTDPMTVIPLVTCVMLILVASVAIVFALTAPDHPASWDERYDVGDTLTIEGDGLDFITYRSTEFRDDWEVIRSYWVSEGILFMSSRTQYTILGKMEAIA